MFIGLLFSTVLLSFSVLLFCCTALFNFEKNRIIIDNEFVLQSKSAFLNRGYWAFSLLFICVFINPFGGNDYTYLVERIQIKLPFLILPFAFLAYSSVSKQSIERLFQIFLLIILGVQIYSCLPYFNDPAIYQELLRKGQSIETPGNHIRFSLLSSLTILGSLHFVVINGDKRYKILFGGLFIISVILLHIIGVRTGLLILYAGALTYGVLLIAHKKNKLLLLLLGSLVFALPILFYNLSEGFRNKIDYMKYDIQQFNEGKGQDYADSGRLVSLDIGYKLWKENKVFGVGYSNIRPQVNDSITQFYPGYHSNLLPHNQFLFALTATGLFGFIVFTLGLLFPWIKNRKTSGLYQRMIFSSFIICLMIDHLFEGTVGVISFLLFMFLGSINNESEQI